MIFVNFGYDRLNLMDAAFTSRSAKIQSSSILPMKSTSGKGSMNVYRWKS